MRRFVLILVLVPLAFFTRMPFSQAQRADTLYFNTNWQICEKPFATYYRFARIHIDTSWFYSGRVLDYYNNDTLEMDGNYSSTGEKEGPFWFFYRDGILKAKGHYSGNRRNGTWEYFYGDGRLWTRIQYDAAENDFSVLDYYDSTGRQLTKDGTGIFEIPVINENGMFVYRLRGACKNGKPLGTWRYYSYIPSLEKEVMAIKEVFDEGAFKKGTRFSLTGNTEHYRQRRLLRAMPEFPKLRSTEGFAKDRTTFRNTKNDYDLLNYLVNRKSPVFNLASESFAGSYTGVLKTLNTPNIVGHFNDPDKFYNGEIMFSLSPTGEIQELSISGNLSAKENEYMQFLMKKFRNIREIFTENAKLETYHKIYFYTVIFAEFVPNRLLDEYPEKMFAFAVMPYDKLREQAKEQMGRKKKTETKKPRDDRGTL